MKKLKTSAFNLSYSNALSFNIGDLVPVYLEDCVPGDHFKITPDFYVKFAPMVFPILQRIEAKITYWFVPNRLLWKRWERYITGGKDGTDVLQPPVVNYTKIDTSDVSVGNGSLADYLGYPDFPSGGQATNGPDYNVLPFYAYQLIWNSFFRDETLSTDFRQALAYALDPGQTGDELEEYDAEDFAGYITSYPAADSIQTQLFTIRKVAWKKDYFTTASPWAQRGASVHIPSNLSVSDTFRLSSSLGEGVDTSFADDEDSSTYLAYANKSVDDALGTLNDFYKASALQRFLQKSINGNRYIEQIANFFGVRVPDYRLQRPEFIGSASKVVQISEVLQTSQSTSGEDASALGTYAGKAAVGGVGKTFDYKVREHGWIIGLMFVRPDASYFQGIRKNLSRVDRFDYYWPEFQGIGEQPIYKKELFAGKNNGDANDQVWAYQSRFSEYKFHNNEIHGDFRDSMDAWTMSRKFLSAPGLNAYFTYVDSDSTGNNRVFAVPSADSTLYGIVNNNVTAFRPMLPYDPLHSI